MVKNAPETTREHDDLWNAYSLVKIAKTPVFGVAASQAEEKLKRVFTDVMVDFRLESLSEFRFFIVFADQYINLCLWTSSRQRVKH